MITNNLKKSYNSIGKTGHEKIPMPYNGIDEDATGNYGACDNAWNVRSGNTLIAQGGFLNMHGAYTNAGFSNRYLYKNTAISSGGGWFVDVGFGNTAESADDYHLADSNAEMATAKLAHKYGTNYAPSTISGSTYSPLMPDNETDTMIRVESVYENTSTTEDVVVKEIGLVRQIGGTSLNASYKNWTTCNYLVARKVLATPVTIHPGETYKFIYRLKA